MNFYGAKVISSAAKSMPEEVAAVDKCASLSQWLERADLKGSEVDCITAVMLKILDGKCKMPAVEKVIMEILYDCARGLKELHLGSDYHQLIKRARDSENDHLLLEEIYETRVLAETQISRPVMKKFKCRLRTEGVLPSKFSEASEDD